MKRILIFMTAAMLATSCGRQLQKTGDTQADTGRTEETENMLASLKKLSADSTYMFGHHDDTMYGTKWQADYSADSTLHTRSDVKDVCGDFPALLSFDLGHLELGHDRNLDGVPFDRIRKEIACHYSLGGMTTLSWHLDNPLSGGSSWVADSLKDVEGRTVAAVLEGGERHGLFLSWLDRVAAFINSLETADGKKIPVLFRPWHEHTGSWFWWGQNNCTAEQYKALWRMTFDRLKEKGVRNALFAYSPGSEPDGDEDRYLERYPGDDIIDLMGLDCYCFAADGDTTAIAAYAAQIDRNLGMVCRLAEKHKKAAALTETGYEGIKAPHWWTHTLAPVLSHHHVSYVLVWRNAHDKPGHFYAPYAGHTSAPDFVKFYNERATLFLKDVKGLKTL